MKRLFASALYKLRPIHWLNQIIIKDLCMGFNHDDNSVQRFQFTLKNVRFFFVRRVGFAFDQFYQYAIGGTSWAIPWLHIVHRTSMIFS